MDLYQADANKPCLSLKCVIMEEKSWKSSYSMWLLKYLLKKSHDKIEIIKQQ